MVHPPLRLDPDLPICWEDPDTLRIGFEHAAVRIARPSAAVQRIIAGFRGGLPLTTSTARRYGVSAADWTRTVELLAPILVECPDPTIAGVDASEASPRLTVDGDGRTSRSLRATLAQSGFSVSSMLAPPDGDGPDPHLLVVVQHFLEPVSAEQLLLAERVPGLLLRFTDRSLWVGPLSLPGASPCWECAAHRDIDADPALPVLAAQLLGREARASAAPLAVLSAATMIAAALGHLDRGDSELRRGRWRIAMDRDAPGLDREFHPLKPHPSCRCAASAPTPAQRGSGTPASAMKREGERRVREPPAVPDRRSASRARVRPT